MAETTMKQHEVNSMSQSEFNPAPITAKAGQVWRTKAGGLYKIPEGVSPLIFDLVEMVRDEDGFTIWRGGEQPAETIGKRVEHKMRCGKDGDDYVDKLRWEHLNSRGDIVAYKVAEAVAGAPAAIGIDPGAEGGDHSAIAFAYLAQGATKDDREYTGGKVNYYEVQIKRPTREGRDPYTAECNDIIEALDMSFAEGEAFKAIWRGAAARKNLAKRGYTDGLYDAEKVAFYGGRMVVQEKSRREKSSSKD